MTPIAALAAMGTAQPQWKVHVEAGLNGGLTPGEITGIPMQMAVHAGFPAALNGRFAAGRSSPRGMRRRLRSDTIGPSGSGRITSR
nr:carboxymuconolactone decarboxylase family protein [Mangrovicoccus ximenensis]